MGCCCDWGRVCWDFDPQGARKCGPVCGCDSCDFQNDGTLDDHQSLRFFHWNLDDFATWNWCEQLFDFLFGTPITFQSGCPSKKEKSATWWRVLTPSFVVVFLWLGNFIKPSPGSILTGIYRYIQIFFEFEPHFAAIFGIRRDNVWWNHHLEWYPTDAMSRALDRLFPLGWTSFRIYLSYVSCGISWCCGIMFDPYISCIDLIPKVLNLNLGFYG